MILIGQYDSPFVRRVAITLRLYGMPYEHHPLSTFADAAEIARYNPLFRVPTLVLENNEAVVDSITILDHLDECAGPDRALVPCSGPARRLVLRVAALATGLTDKAVSLLYEQVMHQEVSQPWTTRCREQIGGTLRALEAECAGHSTAWWFGNAISHADIAVACMLRFLSEAHPALVASASIPALTALADRCEALPPFQETVKPLSPPGRAG